MATIRSATPGDLAGLLGLYVQLSADNAETTEAEAHPALEHTLAAPHITLFVAEEDGRVVGTVTLVVAPGLTHHAKSWAQVENMVVDEALRGTGVGRQLIEACLQTAKSKGCYKVQLQSGNQRGTPENDAHAFYRRVGFNPSSVGFRHYLE